MTSPEAPARPLRNALVAGGLVCSLGLAVFGALVRSPTRFFATNELPIAFRSIAVAVILGTALVAAVLMLAASRGHRAAPWRRRLALISPLLILGALPPLFTRNLPWSELTVLVYLAIVGIVFERLVRASASQVRGESRIFKWLRLAKPRLAWLPWALVIIAVGYYVIGVSYWTIASHHRFESRVSDLAEFDNLFYNALRGHPFRSPAMTGRLVDGATFAHHAHLGLYLLLPIYAIRPGPEILLVVQAVLVGTTAIPVFLLARKRLGNPTGVLVALCFLSLPVLAQPNFYDFHFTALGLHLTAWLIYAADAIARSDGPVRKRWFLALAVLTLLVLAVREEFGVGVVYVGLVLSCVCKRIWVGMAVALVGVSYFCTMKFFVMPRFGEFDLVQSYATLVPEGAPTFRGVLLTLLSNPWFVSNHTLLAPKLQYLLHFSVPLAFLWWRRPWLLTALLPGLAFTFLATDRPPYFSTGFQYSHLFLAYVVAATVYGIESLRPKRRRFSALAAMLLLSFAAAFQFGVLLGNREILGGFYRKPVRGLTQEDRTKLQGMRELVAMIPPDAAVAATETEGTHVSTRRNLFSIKLAGVPKEAAYVMTSQHIMSHEARAVKDVLVSGAFGVEAIRGPFALLRRGADPAKNEVALRMIGH